MRIGIDVSVLEIQGGIPMYVRTLLEGMMIAGSEHEFLLYGSAASFLNIPKSTNFHLHEVEPQHLGAAVREAKLDIFHGPDYRVPTTQICPTVVTVHDTLILSNPDRIPRSSQQARLRETLSCAKCATALITVSNYSARCIEEHFGIAKEKIAVIYNGLLPCFRLIPREKALAGISALDIPSPYILYTGGINRRKNVHTLLASFQEVCTCYKHPITLVLSRGLCNGAIAEEVAECLEQFPDLLPDAQNHFVCGGSHLILTEAVENEDLVALYNLAEVVIYPSLCEGFGLPPIEAMACGAPVVASNTTCLPEILGDAAILADPYDVHGFAFAILNLLQSKELNGAMRRRGLKHVEQYSACRMATETLDLYRAVLSSSC